MMIIRTYSRRNRGSRHLNNSLNDGLTAITGEDPRGTGALSLSQESSSYMEDEDGGRLGGGGGGGEGNGSPLPFSLSSPSSCSPLPGLGSSQESSKTFLSDDYQCGRPFRRCSMWSSSSTMTPSTGSEMQNEGEEEDMMIGRRENEHQGASMMPPPARPVSRGRPPGKTDSRSKRAAPVCVPKRRKEGVTSASGKYSVKGGGGEERKGGGGGGGGGGVGGGGGTGGGRCSSQGGSEERASQEGGRSSRGESGGAGGGGRLGTGSIVGLGSTASKGIGGLSPRFKVRTRAMPATWCPVAPPSSTLVEAQESGEMLEQVDEANFAMDGLKRGAPLKVLRASVASLAQLCGSTERRRLLRTHGLARPLLDSVVTLPLEDPALALACAAILYFLAADGRDDDMIDSTVCIRFLLQLLSLTPKDSGNSPPAAVGGVVSGFGRGKGEKDKRRVHLKADKAGDAVIAKISALFGKRQPEKWGGPPGDADGSDGKLDNLSSRWLALLTLERACAPAVVLEQDGCGLSSGSSGFSQRTGQIFKERLREAGGLDAVCGLASECVSQIRAVAEELGKKKSSGAEPSECRAGSVFDFNDCEGVEGESGKSNEDQELGSKEKRAIRKDVDILLRCMRVMENVTFCSESNQKHLIELKLPDPGGPDSRTFIEVVLDSVQMLTELASRTCSEVESRNDNTSGGTQTLSQNQDMDVEHMRTGQGVNGSQMCDEAKLLERALTNDPACSQSAEERLSQGRSRSLCLQTESLRGRSASQDYEGLASVPSQQMKEPWSPEFGPMDLSLSQLSEDCHVVLTLLPQSQEYSHDQIQPTAQRDEQGAGPPTAARPKTYQRRKAKKPAENGSCLSDSVTNGVASGCQMSQELGDSGALLAEQVIEELCAGEMPTTSSLSVLSQGYGGAGETQEMQETLSQCDNVGDSAWYQASLPGVSSATVQNEQTAKSNVKGHEAHAIITRQKSAECLLQTDAMAEERKTGTQDALLPAQTLDRPEGEAGLRVEKHSLLDDEGSRLVADCLVSAMKVLMNLTNDNPLGCRQVAQGGGIDALALLLVAQCPLPPVTSLSKCMVTEGLAEELSGRDTIPVIEEDLDLLVVVLGVLVNLVEKDESNSGPCAGSLEGNAEDADSPVDRRTLLRNEVLSKSRDAWECSINWAMLENDVEAIGVQEAEAMIVEAYTALLLAFLSRESDSARKSIEALLPDGDLSSLVPVLEHFVNFHMQLNTISPEGHAVVRQLIDWCLHPSGPSISKQEIQYDMTQNDAPSENGGPWLWDDDD
ncbi:hypothetical protein CBR_g19729 [Chara braunii]|uniref:Wings apart-like protein C-terminal domain-containing protein n=1 Tax=Chara braunii TaxID=69332 RepID=A0A388JTQ4_CHABU|nr:hypothetical protein CBR_g19729 [Chara braunii]|eukprot:GBG61196.1 hypothetical protein CBR_g19729 [Chara braunii]